MSLGQIEAVGAVLAKAYGPDAPAVIVYKASQPEEKIVNIKIFCTQRQVYTQI